MKLSDFCNVIRSWTNFQHPDDIIISWVRMAEERMNLELRHKDMILRATAQMIDDTSELPVDWLELTSVRFPNCKPHGYVSEDDFWSKRSACDITPVYTILGNTLMVNPIPSTLPQPLSITYYAELIPVSEVGPNYFLDKYPRLYTFATLALSAPFMLEDERIMVWEAEATRLLTMMNEASRRAKYSGSPLRLVGRTFG